MSAGAHRSARDVFLYVPNIIGYVRVLLAVASFVYIEQPSRFLPLYGLSCLLDVADGYAARQLGQSSRLGAVLDMVTDRSTTAGLLCHLVLLYPRGRLAFQLLLALDLVSHYAHIYASLTTGATSHKSVGREGNALLRLYYTSRTVLFLACAGNELFFMALYMVAYQPRLALFGTRFFLWESLVGASAPIFAFKQAMNVVQLYNAAHQLASLDAKAKIQ